MQLSTSVVCLLLSVVGDELAEEFDRAPKQVDVESVE